MPKVPKADSVHATPVRVAPVIRGLLRLSSQYPGELDADTSDLASKISGRLNTVEVRIEDRLMEGEVVAVVDDTNFQNQLKVAQVEVVEANSQRVMARLRVAEEELERMERLFRELLISSQQIESDRSSVRSLKAELQAPLARVIVGGLTTSTLTTLAFVPCLYFVVERSRRVCRVTELDGIPLEAAIAD